MRSTEHVKKTIRTRNEMDGQNEETSQKPMDKNSKEQEQLEEIYKMLKLVV